MMFFCFHQNVYNYQFIILQRFIGHSQFIHIVYWYMNTYSNSKKFEIKSDCLSVCLSVCLSHIILILLYGSCSILVSGVNFMLILLFSSYDVQKFSKVSLCEWFHLFVGLLVCWFVGLFVSRSPPRRLIQFRSNFAHW